MANPVIGIIQSKIQIKWDGNSFVETELFIKPSACESLFKSFDLLNPSWSMLLLFQ